jgi:hypothetical protein
MTWNDISLPSNGIQSISFADSNHGLVVMRNQIVNDTVTNVVAYTINGGESWDTAFFYGAILDASFPDTSTAYVCSDYNLYRLSTADLAVQAAPQDSTGAWLESESGNLFIIMPQNSGGRLRIIDELGRVLQESEISPGGRCEISNTSPGQPQFRFAEVECNGKVQVFKVMQ